MLYHAEATAKELSLLSLITLVAIGLCSVFCLFLNRRIVVLQCCVNFCYTAKRLSYTHIFTLFILFSIMVYSRRLGVVP